MPPTSLLIIFEVHDLATNGAVHQELHAERVVDQLDEVATELFVVTRPAADGADLYVGMIRVGVLHFVMRAGGHSIELAIAAIRFERHAIELLSRKRRMVIPHVKGVRVLQRSMLANFPGLQMLERHLEVGAFRIREWPVRLAQAHRPAHLVRYESHGGSVRVHERRVHIEPHVGISRHRVVEDRLWWQAEIIE